MLVQEPHHAVLVVVDSEALAVREDVGVGLRGPPVLEAVAREVVPKLRLDRRGQEQVLVHRVEVVDEARAGDLSAHHRPAYLPVALQDERLQPGVSGTWGPLVS